MTPSGQLRQTNQRPQSPRAQQQIPGRMMTPTPPQNYPGQGPQQYPALTPPRPFQQNYPYPVPPQFPSPLMPTGSNGFMTPQNPPNNLNGGQYWDQPEQFQQQPTFHQPLGYSPYRHHPKMQPHDPHKHAFKWGGTNTCPPAW